MTGHDVEYFFVDGRLAEATEGLNQAVNYFADFLFGTLHGCEATGVLAGQGTRNRLKE